MNKIIQYAVMVAVGVLIFSALLVPIINDATTTEKTFVNDEYYITMDKLDSASEHTITWEKDTNTKITVDGKVIEPDWNSITIVAEENNLIRCSKGTVGYYLNFVGEDVPTGYGSSNDKSVSVTIANGSITFSGVTSLDTTYSATSAFTSGYVINPDDTGDYQYIMKESAANAYVLGDSEIYGIGYSSIGGAWNNIFSVSGNIDDGINVTLVSTTLEGDITLSDPTVTYSEVAGYDDLYQFEKVQFTATYNNTNYPLTYSFVIVPAEVTAELAIHPDSATNSILGIIPLIVIVGLIAGIIGAIAIRRNA